MATSPNFNWPEPDNTDLVKNGALAIRTAVNAIDTSLVDLKGGTTGQVLSKTSNTDMDFTWVAQDDANAIQNTQLTAKGALISAFSAGTPATLTVGANNTVLVADSAEATGLKWAGGWTSWTPTITNYTTGNGTIVARYQQVGKTVNWYILVTLGSTSAVTGSVYFTLPVSPASNQALSIPMLMRDTGTAWFYGTGIQESNVVYANSIQANGTYAYPGGISNVIPFTWTTNDFFTANGTYEVA
jgi:hypothetical protein